MVKASDDTWFRITLLRHCVVGYQLRKFDPVGNFLQNFFLREYMLAECHKIQNQKKIDFEMQAQTSGKVAIFYRIGGVF